MLSTTRKIVIAGPAQGQTAELDVLVEKGPLCVAGVWNWTEDRREQGLFFIYLKRDHEGFAFGPFYASFILAERDMHKAVKAFPWGFWSQPLEWLARQKNFQEWVEKTIGKPDELIGGRWVKDEEAEQER